MLLLGYVLLLLACQCPKALEFRQNPASGRGGAFGTAYVLKAAFHAQSHSVVPRAAAYHGQDGTSLRASRHDPDIVAWVSFGKVGSTTMRQLLSARAAKHDWHTYPGSQGMCTAKPLNLSSTSLPQCSDVERSNVVQTDFGYCNLLQGARSCKYMTLVREPLDMMVSRYNYYCLACAENGTECPGFTETGEVDTVARDRFLRKRKSEQDPRMASRPILTCPNMSLVDYARYAGNIYTGMFSGRKTLCDQDYFTNISTGNEAYMACRNTLNTGDFRKALAFPMNKQNLILRLESLYSEDIQPNGVDQLAAFLHEGDMALSAHAVLRNKNKHQYTPSIEEKKELRNILIYDVLLYATIVEQRG